DVPPAQRLLLLVQRIELLARRDLRRLERRARPLERAVDRGDARLEQLRDLVRAPAQRLTQDQHRPLLRREMLKRGDERQSERLALLRELRGVAVRDDPPLPDPLAPPPLPPWRPRAVAAAWAAAPPGGGAPPPSPPPLQATLP